MKKLIGIFDIKKFTPEQIFKSVQNTLQERDRLELIEIAKKRGKQKK